MTRMFARTRQFLAFLAALGSLGQVAPARAEAGWKPTADDALLLDVRLGQYRLGDGVRGYQTPGGVCVDLADTIMALDLPMRLDKKLRRATGWAFDERRSVTIDREANAVQIMNKSEKLASGVIFDAPEGWCVDTKRLAAWLGVELNADLNNATLFVKSAVKLPVEMAAERRARAARIRPAESFDLKTLPQARVAFAGVKTPSIDAVVSMGVTRDRATRARTDFRYELFASGEIGPVAYDARLASNRKGVPESLRLRAYRADPDGGLLGPLGATQVAVGDVAGFSTQLVAQSSIGRGAMITNRPLNRPESFDRTDFRGELPIGWDAELYRNGQLLGFAMNRADGRYEFLDVPLLYGQNRFEIVIYGPQGQVRREERVVSVGADSIPPRKTFYWAGINQDGRDLIGMGGGLQFGTGRWRGSAGVERGLDTRTSVAFAAHSLYLREVGRRNFLEIAGRRAIGPALVEISAANDFQGGTALRAQMIGEFGKTYVSAESVNAMGGFRSDRVLQGVTGVHEVMVDHPLRLGRAIVPLHGEARLTTRASGNDSLDLTARASTAMGRYVITGDLTWRQNSVPFGPDPPGILDAGLLANARVGRLRLRGETRFRLSPDARFESATIVGEWSGRGDEYRASNWRAELGYDKPFDRARAGLGYVRRFDKVAITASAEAATDGSVAGGINVSFSLGPDPRKKGGIRVTSARIASLGQVLARVFRDNNGDGVRQADEPFEKDVQLAAGRVPVQRLTDANGEAIIEDLEPFVPVLIGIDAGSLPDPLIQPAGPGMVVTPRPGIAATVDLALAPAGELDGTLVRDGGTGIEGVDLELVDRAGRVVARTRSDFDGFFLFERVPYGQYDLRISKLSADAARLSAQLGQQARIDARTSSIHLGAVLAASSAVRSASGP
jgi:hypothetical protein